MKIALALAALMLATGCTASGVGTDEYYALSTAYDDCHDEDSWPAPTMTLGDNGHTLMVDTGDGGDFDGLACVMVALGTPESVVTRIDSTNALMGAQEVEADGFTYNWSYHPDNGLNLVITDGEG